MKCSPTTILNKYIIFFILVVFPSTVSLCAQVTIGKPTLGFSQICANPSFNTFEVSFSFSPAGSLGPTNQFILELSDPAGNFGTPLVLNYTEKPLTATPTSRTFVFSVPNSTAGELYKLRVRSTAPASTSSVSNTFAAYFKIQDSQFTINNFNGTATYCNGGSLILTIDNPGTGTNDSPLKYPSLTFKWFKEPSLVPIATTPTLTVNQPGRYYVETNYGTCTSDSYSNRVTVSEATAVSASITSSKGNPFCAGTGPTTLSTQTGNSYQWSKDGAAIIGATSQQYQASTGGQYSVTVNFGSCSSTASINLQDVPFSSSLNVAASTIINQGETKSIIATTDATNPTFEWYRDNVLITSATTNTLNVSEEGNYSVIISQTSGCISQKTLPFEIKFPFVDPNVVLIPNYISPNNDGVNDTWILPQEYVSGSNTEIVLLNSRGEIALQTNNYQNNWPENELDFKSVNPIYYYIITTADNKVKKGSITVVK